MAFRRLTRQRQAVLEVVRDSHDHPDAAAIYAAVRPKIPSISLGTVYRTLEALASEGAIKAIGPAEATRYDGNLEPHHHLRCRGCSQLFDLPSAGPDLVRELQQIHPELVIDTVEVQYQGLCPECSQRSRSASQIDACV